MSTNGKVMPRKLFQVQLTVAMNDVLTQRKGPHPQNLEEMSRTFFIITILGGLNRSLTKSLVRQQLHGSP